jgi:hypothetical protein
MNVDRDTGEDGVLGEMMDMGDGEEHGEGRRGDSRAERRWVLLHFSSVFIYKVAERFGTTGLGR